MNTMNVNGQNGVATSALKNAVVKAVKMINKAEYAKKGFVIIEEGHRLSFDGVRFIKNNKDNFIFNGKIEIKGGNGRYDQVIVEIHHKNLDNDGLCLNDMVNAVLDAILNYIDDVIVKCSSDVGHIIVKNNDDVDEDDISSFVSIYQVIRECYFGSKLVVNNTEDLNNPYAFDTPEAFVMGIAYENDGCMQSCVEMYGDRFIKAVSILWNNHLQNMTENYDTIDNNDIMFGKYLSNNFYTNEGSAIQFWNEVAEDSELFMKFKPCIVENDMTIRKFCEIYKNENGDVEAIINHFINDFMDPSSVEVFENLWEKLEDAIFFISEDADGDLYVAGNEYFCMTYFNDDVPMSQVYSSLIDSMKKEITKIENKIEKEIEESKYEVLDAFACESDFNVDYSEWWDYVMGKTPDWVEDKYYEKFCDVLYSYFVEYAKEYNYGVEKIDGGISLEKI